MKTHRLALWTAVGALTLVSPSLAAPARKAALAEKYVALVRAGDPNALARELLQACSGETADEEMDAAGQQLAIAPTTAAAVLDTLANTRSVESATLQAELLTWMARGDDRSRPTEKAETMATDEVGRRAAQLLVHGDPFVRGLAEWAIAIRLSAEYECAETRVNGRRLVKPWPGEDAPEWYRVWATIDAGRLVEFDYVRQASAGGAHRTSAGLQKSAEAILNRAEGLLNHIERHGTAERAATARAAAAKVRAAFAKLADAFAHGGVALSAQRQRWLDLRTAARELVQANPDLNFAEILFATRQATPANGNITAGRWNVHTPGGDIYIKRGFEPGSPAAPLLQDRLGTGHVRGLDLWWEADRLVFAFARQPGRNWNFGEAPRLRPNSDLGGYFGQGIGEVEELSRLFEMNIDGSQLRQLTEARYNVDQEPAYLPNGDIVFVSDRSNYGSQCAGALEQDNMILNLYRCDPDGKNLRALSNNKDFDRHPRVMENGQILFLHWEYQERHLWQTHSLWTCRPDGSMTDAIYKQHLESGPMSLRDARQIYGQSKLVAIACGHHNWEQGAVFVVDYSQGVNQREGIRNVTPGVSGTEGGYGGVKPVDEGGVRDRGGHYMFPFPLSDKSFLVSYSYKQPQSKAGLNYSLYYIDVWGNKELLHRDKQLSVAYPMPLRKTPRPPVLPELPPAPEHGPRYAVASVANVYAGWLGAENDAIKYLRISQKVPWPCVRDESKACGFNDLHWMPAAWEPGLGLTDWGAARVIGIVPVEADGSAHFNVPADQPVYFQALDENFLEVRRMRSNVTFRHGETRSCTGCHESQGQAAPPLRDAVPLALRRAPSMPEPPAWGDRIIPDFERHIQPIFDRHCVRCHGEQNPDGGLEFTARKVDGYLQSYRTLFGLKAGDATPFARGWWRIWHPNEPPVSEEAHAAARAFYKDLLRNPPPAQLITVADYTGGAEVTQPRQFGSGKSRLTLTLLRDAKHREVKLSRDEWISLVTWVDLNAQYWGTFVEKDGHFASRRNRSGEIVPPRRVNVVFPDPWLRPPAGEWVWQNENTVALKP